AWEQDELGELLQISQLRDRMTLVSQVTVKTVQTTAYSPVIVLSATASTAKRAQELVKAWAEVCVEVSEEVYSSGKTGVREFIGGRFDSTETDLDAVNQQIRDVEIEWNDELAAAQLAKVHARLLDYQEKLIDTNVKIATVNEEIQGIQTYY